MPPGRSRTGSRRRSTPARAVRPGAAERLRPERPGRSLSAAAPARTSGDLDRGLGRVVALPGGKAHVLALGLALVEGELGLTTGVGRALLSQALDPSP